MALSIGFRVSVSLHLLSKLRGVWLLPRRNSHPLVAPAFLWTRDHLVRPQQQRLRDREAERPRGLEIDDESKAIGLFDWQVLGFRAFENSRDQRTGAPPQIDNVRPVGHEAAGLRKLGPPED